MVERCAKRGKTETIKGADGVSDGTRFCQARFDERRSHSNASACGRLPKGADFEKITERETLSDEPQ